MLPAQKILFEELFDGKPLFASQLELANTLLTDPRTKYHVNKKDTDAYAKAQNRLRSYLSQLLSPSTSRSITEDFRAALQIALLNRLPHHPDIVAAVFNNVVQWITDKNAALSKSQPRSNLEDQFASDFNSSNYIAIITSRPLEIDDPEGEGIPPLRKYLFTDLIERLYNKEKDLKLYRFNFPTESFGQLFWRLLRRVLVRQFRKDTSAELLESLYSKFTIRTATLQEFEAAKTLGDHHIEHLVDETLQLLNRNRYIMVFTTTAPVYGLPLVAMDPSDTKDIKVYAMLESENQSMALHKFPKDETLLWRLFVWDSLKSKKFAGTEVLYSIDESPDSQR